MSPALKSSHPPTLPRLGGLHRWGLLPFGSPGLGIFLMLLLTLPPTLSNSSPTYHGDLKLRRHTRKRIRSSPTSLPLGTVPPRGVVDSSPSTSQPILLSLAVLPLTYVSCMIRLNHTVKQGQNGLRNMEVAHIGNEKFIGLQGQLVLVPQILN
jgi:hypothetical protein